MSQFLEHSHDIRLVAFAVFIGVVTGCGTTLMLRFLSGEGKARRKNRLVICAMLTGFGIWATHFIAMLGYDPSEATSYALVPTIASLLLVQCAIWTAFKVVFDATKRFWRYIGGAVAGVGIAVLHYVGMYGASYFHAAAFNPALVALSVSMGVILSAFAIPMMATKKLGLRSVVGGVSFIIAVLVVHFVGMAAMSVNHAEIVPVTGFVISSTELAGIVGVLALIVLCAAIVATFIELQSEIRASRERSEFGFLIQSLRDSAIYLLDTKGNILTWNEGASRLKGFSASEAIGLHFSAFFSEEDRKRQWPQIALDRAVKEGAFRAESKRYRKDGSWFWADVSVEPVYDVNGTLKGFAKVTRDVTQRKAFEGQVSVLSANLDAALENMRQGLCLFDAKGKLVLSNRRTADILDLDVSDLVPGLSFLELLDLVVAGYTEEEGRHRRARALEAHDRFMATQEGGSYTVERKGGSVLAVSERPRIDGGWVSTFEDISESRRSAKRIRHLANHDPLTGLPNRIYFRQLLDQNVEDIQARGGKVALAMIDLNRFKDVNDKYGHAIGDDLLQVVAQRLTGAMGEDAVATRLGGDEFAVFQRVSSQQDVDVFAETLETALLNIAVPDYVATFVSGCVGIATFPKDAENVENLMSNADIALQRAKSKPAKHCCQYEPDMDEGVRKSRGLQADILEAVKEEQFQLVYQVQCAVADGKPVGYEALLRWMHPVHGLVTPDRFIDAAEQNGLIIPLGEWVMRRACKDAASWPKPYKVAVNISPVQLVQMDLPKIITEALLEAGLPASRLEIEITETAIISDKMRALTNLRRIKSLGVSVSMDDFGTGYSSLDTLNSFEFDKIKIDRSFLMDSATNPNSQVIIRAVVALGQSLGLPVLAEGVETEEQLQLLRSMNCDEAQGYYFGKPGPYLVDDGGDNALEFVS
ncbi:EAL domain-containing protein [Altererythrobacter indicus]|uniref:EAL domain-containing protein n=1 Tax=Altericroceibacterium indicum TaxID=374177 RepID=A0A845A8D8_9SPHN|nr:EAL domain-containing protein [Altericroceibacterium indicum]MXP25095.1 EAL domain-containing protein [Altericroceibacterium indicum]